MRMDTDHKWYGSPAAAFTLLYGLLIVHMSLFPYSGGDVAGNPCAWLVKPLPHYISRKDALVNFLAYIPFGCLFSWYRFSRGSRRGTIVLSLLAGCFLSIAMESLQAFIPTRDPSLVDIAINSAGAAMGAVLARLFGKSIAPGGRLCHWQDYLLVSGRSNCVGAGVLLLWALARLSPFIPPRPWPIALKKASPLWLTLHGKLPFLITDTLVHSCYSAGVALLAVAILRAEVKPVRLFAVTAVAVLLLRFFVLSGCLTLEEVAGYAIGLVAVFFLSRLSGGIRDHVAGAVLLTGFILFELKAGGDTFSVGQFNWIPFRYHLDNPLSAIGQILEGVWPFSAVALLWLRQHRESTKGAMVYGGGGLFLVVALLEWNQQAIPGRTADITQALLALIGWSWPFCLLESGTSTEQR